MQQGTTGLATEGSMPTSAWASPGPDGVATLAISHRPGRSYRAGMDGYTFEATVSGVRVAFRICGATILKWRHGIAPEGDMQPVKDTARRLARAHLRVHGAEAGESWSVSFTGEAVECKRLRQD